MSLLPLLRGEALPSRPLFSELSFNGETARVIFEFPWKLIHNFNSGGSELYNLETDPGEKTNVAELHGDIKARLEQRLLAWVSGTQPLWPVEKPADISPETLQQLQALGYMEPEKP